MRLLSELEKLIVERLSMKIMLSIVTASGTSSTSQVGDFPFFGKAHHVPQSAYSGLQ
jgi:hypothetical protein